MNDKKEGDPNTITPCWLCHGAGFLLHPASHTPYHTVYERCPDCRGGGKKEGASL